jgi:hypothetical protein
MSLAADVDSCAVMEKASFSSIVQIRDSRTFYTKGTTPPGQCSGSTPAREAASHTRGGVQSRLHTRQTGRECSKLHSKK